MSDDMSDNHPRCLENSALNVFQRPAEVQFFAASTVSRIAGTQDGSVARVEVDHF